MFILLEDGISYVCESATSMPDGPGGRMSMVRVPMKLEANVVDAALECPGECIFIEEDATYDRHHADAGSSSA